MPSKDRELNLLVQKQTDLFNKDATLPEKEAVLKQIQRRQRELKQSGK